MGKQVAVEVNDIHKEFVLPQYKNRSVKQAFVNIFRRPTIVSQKALRGVSFTVNKGDFFGVVGRNGSGKSTLLKMLAGVYQPTSGSIAINGKLTPFIELGVGFNPELSGRDNVFLNGALLGFTRKQMEEMYDDIVAFAELDEFMDQKLKNYSSGMQVRLAFSIAIKAKNDILIFDEVLAVGDEAFQRKCYDVFEQYRANGQTVILVSHDMAAIRNFCNRAVLIHDGKIIESGSPSEVATIYSQLNQESIDAATAKQNIQMLAEKNAKHLSVVVGNGETSSFEHGTEVELTVNVAGLEPSAYESVGVTIVKQSGEHIGGINSRVLQDAGKWKRRGQLKLRLTLDFAPGKYHPYVELFSKPGTTAYDITGPSFEVRKTALDWSGLTKLNAKWVAKEKK
jgi:ABC-2 type transport system ATP-binding protein